LFALGRELTLQDLRKHRHLVIRDTGSQRSSGSWLRAEQSWTVSHKATSIHAAGLGLGFAWFPEEMVRRELKEGLLKQLPLREGSERWADLYLVHADRDYAGPGAVRLAQIIREHPVFMPPLSARGSVPCIEGMSGSAARLKAMTHSR
jgi:DNA-binding transcriptional LysR family regulator